MNSPPGKWRRRWLWVAAILLVLLFVPFPYLASPRWEVWVVHEDGSAASEASVYLHYHNYCAESDPHDILLTADENGHVVFASQRSRASLAQLVFFTLSSATAGVHASFGRHAWVMAFVPHKFDSMDVKSGMVFDWQGSPDSVHSKLVLKPLATSP